MTAVRPLSAAEAVAMGVSSVSMTGTGDAPATELSKKFGYQSYFDFTLAERAILRQPPNEAIVPSTRENSDLGGYAIGLHPSSETPIAVRFRSGQQQGSSTTYRLKPGQVLRPFGAPGSPGKFSGFEWGLPFGWLGGGNATIIVFRTSDADVDWSDRSELIFHRMRLPILAANATVAPSSNWPTRFPWQYALSGIDATNSYPQRGQPALAVAPTRTLLRLRMQTVSAAAAMRVFFTGTDAFDEDNTGNIVAGNPATAVDVQWSSWASVAVAGVYTQQFQTQMFTGELERLSCNMGGGVALVDLSGGVLTGQYVDVVRYGVL